MWNGPVKYDGSPSWFVGLVGWLPGRCGRASATRRAKTQRPQRVSGRTYGLDAAGEPVAMLLGWGAWFGGCGPGCAAR
jgi:hypothetical protein